MVVHKFKRGLKLDPRKYATEGKAIEFAPLPKQVVIPVNQHFGSPNKCIVEVGDRVKRGQRLTEGVSPGPMTVPVHASISGVVKKIEPRALANNSEGLCVVIEADGSGDEEFMLPLDPFACTKEEALQRIRDAGIIGMGGAGFPSHVKLNPPSNKPVDIIIANGAECEPYLTIDEAVMVEKTGLILDGLSIIMNITGVKKAFIGIEDNKASLIPVFEKELERGRSFDISIKLCKTLYPQGGEKMLIKALTGREVPSGGLPMDVGCIVSNVGTLSSIAEAFSIGKPLIDRNLTVSGGACKNPKNICVPVGTIPAEFPADFIDVDHARLRKVVFGGPMMGFAVSSLNVPIQKNTSGIVFFTEKELFAQEEGNCIRCGGCIRNCSCRLSPVVINNALEAGDVDEAVQAGLNDCVECGCCSYVCPARLKLTQRFRSGKQRLRLKQQEQARRAAENNMGKS